MTSDVLTDYWTDLIGLTLALVLVNASLSRKLYTGGRGGGRRVIATIRSSLGRLGILIIAIVIVFWLVIDLRHKLGVQ